MPAFRGDSKTRHALRELIAYAPEGYTSYDDSISEEMQAFLIAKLIEWLNKSNVDKVELMSKYSSEYLSWLVPPVILPINFYGQEYEYVRSNDVYPLQLLKNFDTKVAELIKDGDENALVDFVLKGVFDLRILSVSGMGIYTTNKSFFIGRGNGKLLGIKDGVIVGHGYRIKKLDLSNINDIITAPRGICRVNTFDILDRAKLWMEERLGQLPDYEAVEAGLATLKLRGKWQAAYAFEQALYRPHVKKVKVEPKLRFTDELLDSIRDMWGADDIPLTEKYFELNSIALSLGVKPLKWERFFGIRKILPGDHIRDKRAIMAIEKGYSRFIDYFLIQKRKENEC